MWTNKIKQITNFTFVSKPADIIYIFFQGEISLITFSSSLLVTFSQVFTSSFEDYMEIPVI